MRTRARLLPLAGLSLAGLLLGLLVAELAARVFAPGPLRVVGPRALETSDKSYALDAYPTPPAGGFDADLRDPAVRLELEGRGLPGVLSASRATPYGVRFAYNPQRCRQGAVGPPAPGVARVLALGDSFTEGQGVREESVYPRVLERSLRAEGASVEVLNCGRRGADFPWLLERFEGLVARYEPRVVLYGMVLNDAAQSPSFHARQGYLNDWILDRRRMLEAPEDVAPLPWWRPRLASLLGERLEAARVGRATTRWYLDMYGAPNAEGWQRTQDSLARMRDLLRARGGVLVVALLPLLVGLEGRDPFEPSSRAIREACLRLGIDFYELRPAVQGEASSRWWVHSVDLHPNARAHARFAEALRAPLRAALGSAGLGR